MHHVKRRRLVTIISGDHYNNLLAKELNMTSSTPVDVIPVWPGVAPGSEEWTHQEITYLSDKQELRVRNITRPSLTPFFPSPELTNGTAIIICPGGAFRFLSWWSEGTAVAEWLAARGVTCFVLKYRLVETAADEAEFQQQMADLSNRLADRSNHGKAVPNVIAAISSTVELAVADGRQAVKVVRQRASEWQLASDRIGLLGFSAGARLTMGVVMDCDADSRPNFAAPIYGGGTADKPVPVDAPPLFILGAADDPIAARGPQLYSAWREAGHSAELHLYAQGGHGFGMKKQNLPVDTWIERFGDWLQAQGVL
jgi:acetyl esterase/lipase